MLKIQILGLSCRSFASVGLAWALESVILTSCHGNFYEQEFWKTLLQIGEDRLKFGQDGTWSGLAVSAGEVCDIGAIWGEFLGGRGCVWLGRLCLSGFRLCFQPLAQCLTHSQHSANICRP